jgi:hypothetical protein
MPGHFKKAKHHQLGLTVSLVDETCLALFFHENTWFLWKKKKSKICHVIT